MTTHHEQQHTHFGFKTVAKEEKVGMVRQVFSSVAGKYDLMNDMMSAGIHHLWKDRMIELLPAGGALLDVAGGTGDIAFRYAKKCHRKDKTPRVTVCDINQAMLETGRNRSIDKNCFTGLSWACGNAESLPFPDNMFDYYTIAFGIRNVTTIPLALKEAYRVLKPGGKFVCLEFSHVIYPLLAKLYDSYSFHMIPLIGQIIAGDRESYQYLVESIRNFPDQGRFKDMIEDAGFTRAAYENLTAGVTALHHGWKI